MFLVHGDVLVSVACVPGIVVPEAGLYQTVRWQKTITDWRRGWLVVRATPNLQSPVIGLIASSEGGEKAEVTLHVLGHLGCVWLLPRGESNTVLDNRDLMWWHQGHIGSRRVVRPLEGHLHVYPLQGRGINKHYHWALTKGPLDWGSFINWILCELRQPTKWSTIIAPPICGGHKGGHGPQWKSWGQSPST